MSEHLNQWPPARRRRGRSWERKAARWARTITLVRRFNKRIGTVPPDLSYRQGATTAAN
ncbi:MAG TPA: hypothetical protein VF121_01215 [Thermoanaerobaculia bacterium]|nr:hypothetical protein [Thermoanaerobaculia bacterium]